jgi:hypothetical protein
MPLTAADGRLWQIFSFVQLDNFISTRGYTFFLVCLYILAAAQAANVALCVWVANSFKNNSFNHVWCVQGGVYHACCNACHSLLASPNNSLHTLRAGPSCGYASSLVCSTKCWTSLASRYS